MPFEAINHLVFVPADPAFAKAAVSRIGWPVGLWRNGWTVSLGSAANPFHIWVDETGDHPPGVSEIGLQVADLRSTLAALDQRGLTATLEAWPDEAETALLPTLAPAGVNLRLVQWTGPCPVTPPAGVIAVKRLDHLALITHDLEATSRFWETVLGVPRFGEVWSPVMLIRQYRIGDAIIELLGPTIPESPLWKRTPGPAPVVSVEVADANAAVAAAVAAGFTVPPAANGVLPDTWTATVPLAETGGLNWQLLQYV